MPGKNFEIKNLSYVLVFFRFIAFLGFILAIIGEVISENISDIYVLIAMICLGFFFFSNGLLLLKRKDGYDFQRNFRMKRVIGNAAVKAGKFEITASLLFFVGAIYIWYFG